MLTCILQFYSYAREWQAKLRELQEGKLVAAAAAASLLNSSPKNTDIAHLGGENALRLSRSPSKESLSPPLSTSSLLHNGFNPSSSTPLSLPLSLPLPIQPPPLNLISITPTTSTTPSGGGPLSGASATSTRSLSVNGPSYKRNGKQGGSPKNKSSPSRRGLVESPIKMDSNGALNLASSPSPRDHLTSSSPVSMVASADTSRSPPRTGQTFGVEVCVVCGDRASGKFSLTLTSSQYPILQFAFFK